MNPSPERRHDAAIIDLDGTLVDTLGDFTHALNATLQDLGCPPVSPQAVAERIGRGSEHLIRSILDHMGAPQDLYDAAWPSYQRHYRAINGQHARVFDGAVEGLQALRDRGLALACLTNKPGEFARELLDRKGLGPFFTHVLGGDAFARRKPDPLPVLRTCEALATLPARTLVVGDSSNDAQAARGAGCPVVLVTYGYNHGEPIENAGADGYLRSLAELVRWA